MVAERGQQGHQKNHVGVVEELAIGQYLSESSLPGGACCDGDRHRSGKLIGPKLLLGAVRLEVREKVAGDPTSVTFALGSTRTAAGGITIYNGINAASPVTTASTATSTSTMSQTAPSSTLTGTGIRWLNLAGLASPTTMTANAATFKTRDINTGATGVTAFAAEETRPGSWTASAAGTRAHTAAAAASGALISIGLNPARQRQGYTGSGDSSDVSYDQTLTVTERTISLPGGVLVDWRSASDIRWSHPNLHGDIVAEANNSGVKQGATRRFTVCGAVTPCCTTSSSTSTV